MPEGEARALPEGYELRQVLRVGAVTTVVSARSAEHGEVVLKLWNAPPPNDSALRAADREFQLHRSLSPEAAPHPNIVAFVDSQATGAEPPWIATRPGGVDLGEVLRDRSLGHDEAMRISLDILGGLAALHERKLVHGDVTPSNVLVYNGRAALCDLGLAGRSGATAPSIQIGTPEYMAPELIVDPSRPPDARSDVYAAGVVIGEVLDSVALPRAVDHLVYTQSVSANPADRPANAGLYARALRSAMDESSRADRTKERDHPRRRPRSRRHGLVAIAGTVGAALLLGGGWVVSQSLEGGSASPSAPSPGTVSPVATTTSPAMSFDLPRSGPVRSPFIAHGQVPADGRELVWLLQRGPRGIDLAKEPAVVDSSGAWQLRLDLGIGPCDESAHFTVMAFSELPNGPLHAIAREAERTGLETGIIPRIDPSWKMIGAKEYTLLQFRGRDNCPGSSN